jgi:hypothetical protein
MKLIRKQNAPIVIDKYGIEHSNLTISFYATPEDKLNKWLEIHCAYYHTQAADKSQLPDFGKFVMKFDDNKVNSIIEDGQLVKLGWPNYDELKLSIKVDDNGQLEVIADDVLYWILNQEFIKDFEGKVFSENWEIID